MPHKAPFYTGLETLLEWRGMYENGWLHNFSHCQLPHNHTYSKRSERHSEKCTLGYLSLLPGSIMKALMSREWWVDNELLPQDDLGSWGEEPGGPALSRSSCGLLGTAAQPPHCPRPSSELQVALTNTAEEIPEAERTRIHSLAARMSEPQQSRYPERWALMTSFVHLHFCS